MEISHRKNSSYTPSPIIHYKYNPSGQIVNNYTAFYGKPITPLKYRNCYSKPADNQRPTSRYPKNPPKSSQDHSQISQLLLSMNEREIYVMQNGASVFPGQKIPGFYYKFELLQDFNRYSHSQEMKIFFAECQKVFRPVKSEFKFVFSISGKILHCLHELKSDEKIVLVGENSIFSPVQQIEIPDMLNSHSRSPLYKSFFEESDLNVMANLNSHFRITSSKSKVRKLQSRSLTSSKCSKPKPVKLKFDSLKLKLGKKSYDIDKTFPTLYSQGLQKLKEKFKFSEQELHHLYGKYKLLVLLSCGINANHDISSGIARETFVDYYSKSTEIRRILGKIFDKFDLDRGGTVDWEEYLHTMNIIWHGTIENQLDFFFSVYDNDGNGCLSFREIQELCKLQLQMEKADQLIEELSFSFASLIFDLTETKYEEEIPAWKIKEIIRKQQDRSLIEMFCSFNCLK